VSIRDGDRLLDYGEAAWRTEYRRRVIAMMRTLAGERTRVLWLGMPPMRDPRFSERAKQLNRIFLAAAREVPRV
jgi:hypothetical protein